MTFERFNQPHQALRAAILFSALLFAGLFPTVRVSAAIRVSAMEGSSYEKSMAEDPLSGYPMTEYPMTCPENRPGCLLLQSVMSGTFDRFDSSDPLCIRVYSAIYPDLCDLSQSDFVHFCEAFGEDPDLVRTRYYQALADCLHAWILSETASENTPEAAEKVLLLFLDPASAEDAEEQMELIQAGLNDGVISLIAAETGAPEDMIRWLMEPASDVSDASPYSPNSGIE